MSESWNQGLVDVQMLILNFRVKAILILLTHYVFVKDEELQEVNKLLD